MTQDTKGPHTTGRTDVIICPNCGAKNRLPAANAGVPRCGRCHHGLPWLTTATDDDFDAVVLDARLPVLVDLWAPWCGPCRIVEPGVQHVAHEFAGRLKVTKVNVDTAAHRAALPGPVHPDAALDPQPRGTPPPGGCPAATGPGRMGHPALDER